MHPSILAEIEQLPQCTVAQLRSRYEQVFGEPTKSRHRTYLARRIAWRLQANAEGGLSERAKLRAAQLAAESDFRVTPPKSRSEEPEGETITAKRCLETTTAPVAIANEFFDALLIADVGEDVGGSADEAIFETKWCGGESDHADLWIDGCGCFEEGQVHAFPVGRDEMALIDKNEIKAAEFAGPAIDGLNASHELDAFGGSGSTLIACQRTGRHARLIELDPKYCDVIVRRWEAFTGDTAHRVATNDKAPAGAEAGEGAE